MWPSAARPGSRSQTILNTASSGTDSSAPGMPQSQFQNSSEAMTNTGFSVNRRASSMGVIVSPSRMWITR